MRGVEVLSSRHSSHDGSQILSFELSRGGELSVCRILGSLVVGNKAVKSRQPFPGGLTLRVFMRLAC
jgi:hypothetical protein